MARSSQARRRARKVAQLMRKDFITVEPHEPMLEVVQTMRLARLRHVIVAQDGALLGMVSYRDLVELLSKAPGGLEGEHGDERIDLAMRPDLHTTTPDEALPAAASRLWHHHVGCLPVVQASPEGIQLVGLITETDLLRAAYDPLFEQGRA